MNIMRLILLAAVLLLAACSNPITKDSPQSSQPRPIVTIHMVMPGDQSARMKQYLDNEFAYKMKEELGLAFHITYIPWAQYYDKLNLMFASGEDLDLFWSIPSHLAQYVNKKNVLPVDQLLQEHGPNILKHIPQQNFDAVKLNGQMYALPVANAPTAAKFHSLLVREDLLKEAGMDGIRTVQDISDFAAKVKEKHPEMTPIFEIDPLSPYYRAFSPEGVTLTPIGNDAHYYVNEDEQEGRVYSIFDNVEMVKQISEMRADWRRKGYIKDNQLTNFGNALSEFNSGNYALTSGAAGDRAINFIGSLTKNVPTGELNEYLLHPEKPKYTQMVVTDMFYLAGQSKHPERAVQFLNWVFESQSNYDFMINGVLGKDFIESGSSSINKLTTDELWPAWMLYHPRYARFSTMIPDKTVESYKSWDDGSKLSKTAGFVFNTANVKLEVTKVNQIIMEKMNPILWGFQDFETYFPGANKALKHAGIDKIRLEYEEQLKSYLRKQ